MSASAERLERIQAQVLVTFRDETAEGLERLESQLLSLRHESSKEVVDDLFRVVHTIKGNAGSVGFRGMSEIAHAMETVLDGFRRGGARSQESISTLMESCDVLLALLADSQKATLPADTELVARLKRLERPEASAPPAQTVPAAATCSADEPIASAATDLEIRFMPAPNILRDGVDPELLFDQLRALGEATIVADADALPALADLDERKCYFQWSIGIRTQYKADDIRSLFGWLDDLCRIDVVPVLAKSTSVPGVAAPAFAAPVSTSGSSEGVASVRVPVDKIDALLNVIGELVITESELADLERADATPRNTNARSRTALARLSRITRSLHASALRLRSMPVGVVFNRFPRLIDDLSRKLNKAVQLELVGEATELDKTIIDKLGDVLVHLVRNAIDHGLEDPAERTAAGKPPAGRLTMRAQQCGTEVIIEVSDDGRGLNRKRILETARARGLIDPNQTLSEDEIDRLILLPGFSTVEQVSDVSGRGVGMDAVERNVRLLGGSLHVESTPGQGMAIKLRLPMTLAIVEGQVVRFGGRRWIVPVPSILECVMVEETQVSRVFGRTAVYRLREQVLPLIDPCVRFGLPGSVAPRVLIVAEGAGEPVGILVEELLGRQQVVLKSLEAHFRRVDGIGGATVLGDGSVAFILDPNALTPSNARTPNAAEA